MTTSVTLFPAYGRTYTHPDQIIKDFEGGKDFSLTRQGGPYATKEEIKKELPHAKEVRIMNLRGIPMLVTLEV